MRKNLFVSILIPTRNEEKFISRCLDSIKNQDYPAEKMEVFVIDGMSTDATREIAKKYPFFLVDNLKRFFPAALNIGIKMAKGDIIIILGCHAKYPNDYVRKSVFFLEKYGADNIGGVLRAVPFNSGIVANGIALCLSSFFGAASSFRLGTKKFKEVDTVFGGCYRRELFDKIGIFNEKLKRSTDMEFNLRLKKAGGKIILTPEMTLCYYPSGNLKDFFIHNFIDGVWAVYPLKFVKTPLRFRHYVPLLFVSALIVSLILKLFFHRVEIIFLIIVLLYAFLNLACSFFISIKNNLKYLFVMPLIFAVRHIGYGLGSLWGLVKLIFGY